MVINTTRWSPDTCSCELEYSWDTESSEDTREHIFKRVVKTCDAHMPVVPRGLKAEKAKQVYDTVLEENQRKNQALGKALETRPELADFVDSRTGKKYDLLTVSKGIKEVNPLKAAERLKGGVTLKDGINYNWKWVEDKAKPGAPRTLEIDFDVPETVFDDTAFIATAVGTGIGTGIGTTTTLQPKKTIELTATADKTTELQKALDSEFTPEKGRGKVKIATTTNSREATS